MAESCIFEQLIYNGIDLPLKSFVVLKTVAAINFSFYDNDFGKAAGRRYAF